MKKCKIAIEEKKECQNCCLFCEKFDDCKDACEGEPECAEMVEPVSELQVIQSAIPDVLMNITTLSIQKKEIEEQEKLMKEKLLQAMEEHGIKSFENDFVKFLYVAPTTRTSIDSARLKKEKPDIAEEYSKTSKVSASVRITVK